ncbi:MAG TPA: methyltransferase domain-containing protein [Candidatus Dormibacteraeota bacterium]|nr:methyltransferase domain-containing protein [Candidatus Dormibacteraeota bacterium]
MHTQHVEETRTPRGGGHAPAEAPEVDPGWLITRFLACRPPTTARAYAADLEDLARFHKTSTEDVVRSLLLGPETARWLLLDYAVELRRRGLAQATVRRRLATLRTLLATARETGAITWRLESPTEKEVERATAERMERERSSYVFPRHPEEADRLDLQHHALREALGRSYLAPVEGPQRVLDVGTGTGQWGFELCWEHPKALVVGLDLVPGKPGAPAGYRHVRGDVLRGLPFRDDSFDLVHQRYLASGIPLVEWPRVVAELVRVARPGGWVELAEPVMGGRRLGPATDRLQRMFQERAGSLGLDTGDAVFRSVDHYLRQAGLEEVARRELELPVGEWGGRVGSFLASDIRAASTRICEVLQVRGLLSGEEALDLIRRSTQEFEEYRTVWPIAIAYGRKPGRDR